MRYADVILLVICLAVLLAPVIYYATPLNVMDPDIQYVKGKLLWVQEGELYTDPVTGYPNFHPPYYHLLLSLFTRLGVPIDTLLVLVSICNVSLVVLFAYFINRRLYDRTTGIIVALLIPFIYRYMGHGNPFLATSFNFSIAFFLGGLLLCIKDTTSCKKAVITSVLWGVAFLVSPVYLFVVIMIFLYELFIKRAVRRAIVRIAAFVITISPFFVQASVVSRAGMASTSTFSLWRGIPGGGWISDLLVNILSPVEHDPFTWQAGIAVGITLFGVYGLIRTRRRYIFPSLAAAAYLLTAYTFSFQYAIRIHFFISLFLIGSAVYYLPRMPIRRYMAIAIVSSMVLISFSGYLIRTTRYLSERREFIDAYRAISEHFRENLGMYAIPGSYILATQYTYRDFILPNFRYHSLVAYRSGEYFQLSRKLAEEMRADYDRAIKSRDIGRINDVCDKYGIDIAVITWLDKNLPGIQTIEENWRRLHGDGYFFVYSRTGAGR